MSEMSENTNVLENRSCPECGQERRFNVEASSIFTVSDEGTEDHGDVEYDAFSYANCPYCSWEGCWKQTEDHNFMTQEMWDNMSYKEKRQWKDQRGIKPLPECLAVFLRRRVVAIRERRDEEVVFWVGFSAGWQPIYLEMEDLSDSDGDPADLEGYWDIREVGDHEAVILRGEEEIRRLREAREE